MNQKGFSPVIILVILLLLGAVGFSGWRLYQTNNDTTASKQEIDNTGASNEISQDTKTVDRAIPNGWKEYRSVEHGISFQYPEEWLVDEFLHRASFEPDNTQSPAIAHFASPENFKQHLAKQNGSHTSILNELIVRVYPGATINSYVEDIGYDEIGRLQIDGRDAADLNLPNIGGSYGILVEYDKVLFELDFESIASPDDLTDEHESLIESIRFD